MRVRAAAIAAILCAGPAAAEVKSSSPNGFEVVSNVSVAAAPAQVYAAIARVGEWWNGAHSYSGDAHNLTLDPVAGGCFCERWAGGSAEHLRVVHAQPGKLLRLSGGLGPFQGEGAAGALTFALQPATGGTRLTVSYVVGGYVRGGVAPWPVMVDGMIGEQVARLKAYVEKK